MDVIAGKFKVLKQLGQGGFGTVFLTEHVDLKVKYAVKVIADEKALNPDYLERFRREAQALSRLFHKNTVALREFGHTGQGYPYMAMDYTEGRQLNHLLRETGPLSPARALYIAAQLLDVLHEAHQLGIVHRDLKPENIMLETTPDGRDQPKVLDFGLVKLAEGIGGKQVTLTKTGMIMGTPMYMSPEQACAKVVDNRSDVYCVGLILYTMLTARWPYPPESPVDTLMHQIRDYPPQFNHFPQLQIPNPVQNLVYRAIQKNPDRRYSSAAEFAEQCRRLIDQLASQPKYQPDTALEDTQLDSNSLMGTKSQIISADFPSSSSTPEGSIRDNVIEEIPDEIDGYAPPSAIQPASQPPTSESIPPSSSVPPSPPSTTPLPTDTPENLPFVPRWIKYAAVLIIGSLIGLNLAYLVFSKSDKTNPKQDQGKTSTKKDFAFWKNQTKEALSHKQYGLVAKYGERALEFRFDREVTQWAEEAKKKKKQLEDDKARLDAFLQGDYPTVQTRGNRPGMSPLGQLVTLVSQAMVIAKQAQTYRAKLEALADRKETGPILRHKKSHFVFLVDHLDRALEYFAQAEKFLPAVRKKHPQKGETYLEKYRDLKKRLVKKRTRAQTQLEQLEKKLVEIEGN